MHVRNEGHGDKRRADSLGWLTADAPAYTLLTLVVAGCRAL